MNKAFWLAGAMALALASPALAGDTIKIGFVSTFSGPTAVIGNDMRNSFELALDHLGRKMGGKPVEVIYEDDGRSRMSASRRPRSWCSPTMWISSPAISGRTCCSPR